MSRWIGSTTSKTSNSSAGSSNEQRHWPALMTLLATENLRTLTKDIINDLETELHEIIVEMRNISEGIENPLISSKRSLLQNLRSAYIQLNLAGDQLASGGKTPCYYRYLHECQKVLEKAYQQYTNITTEKKNDREQNGEAGLSMGSLAAQGYELINIQQLFQQTYELFNAEDEIWPDQCNQAIANLHTASQPIQGVLELLNDSLELPPGTSPLSYELMGKLYQLNEQMRTLTSLITSLRPLCQTKSKQAIKMKENIIYRLETFNKVYGTVLPHINLFINKYRSLERKHGRPHKLILIKTHK